MIVLGIETSCDETSAAITVDASRILSNVVVSQIDIHKQYGGVVPELASRKHIESISWVIARAFEQAGVTPADVDCIGVTRGPGLIGSLLVGVGVAKSMAMALKKPICGVNHLHGHLFASFLERHDLQFPFVGMVVSGGHTTIFHVKSVTDITVMGKTRDDAAGEAYDKVSKLLGLGYPGGAIIEKMAAQSSTNDMKLPRALMEKDNLDFSFSGLKTAALKKSEEIFGVRRTDNIPGSFHAIDYDRNDPAVDSNLRRICKAFQEAVLDVLVTKGLWAAQSLGADKIVVCGGVAANQALRRRFSEHGRAVGIEPIFPSLPLCADNAAMIAARAFFLSQEQLFDELDFGALSRF
ncbi:MAG: tRNA (adenosine(37)-N6)-threonylcarbamoyltransferase complex transferase subunit TsaD [Desulfomonilaceae bacterium]